MSNVLSDYMRVQGETLVISPNFAAMPIQEKMALTVEIAEAIQLTEEDRATEFADEALEILQEVQGLVKGRNLQAFGLAMACFSSLLLAEGVANEIAARKAAKASPDASTEPTGAETDARTEKILDTARQSPRHGDLTLPGPVCGLMDSSTTQKEWNDNCLLVKQANGGTYPEWWYAEIIQTGKAARAEGLPRGERRSLDSRPGLSDG